MKILIEDNGSEVELEIREYLHLANTVHELGDSDYAISQRGVTKALEEALGETLESKLKKVILLTDTSETNLITFEFNAHLIVSEIDLVIDSGMPIGTNFKIITDSQIVLPLTDTIYNNELIDGSSELTKITEDIWLVTSINTHGELLNAETINTLIESLDTKFSDLEAQISDGHAISNEPNNRLERRLDGLYVRDRLDPDPVAYYLLSRG